MKQERQIGIGTPSIREGGSLRDKNRETRQRVAETRMNRDVETENIDPWRQSDTLTWGEIGTQSNRFSQTQEK